MNPHWRSIFFVLLMSFSSALAGGQHITFQAYGRSQGLDNLAITAVVEDAGGLLWVGTDSGIFRYDGSNFEHLGHEMGLPEGDVSPMFRTSDGTIFAGTAQGLYYGSNNGFYGANGIKLRMGIGSSTQLTEWHSGELLIVATGHLYLAHKVNQTYGSGWNVMDAGDQLAGLPRDLKINSVRPQGAALWMGCGEEICRWQDGRLTRFGEAQEVPRQTYYGIRVGRDGSVWARSIHSLMQMDSQGKWHDRTQSVGLGSLITRFPMLTEDTDGQTVLVAGGIVAIHTQSGWTHLGTHEGLPDIDIATINFAHDSIWLGTQGAGLLRIKGYRKWKNCTRNEGLPNNTVWQMTEDQQGNLLAGTNAGIARKSDKDTVFTPLPLAQEKPCVTYGLANDSEDRIWSTCENSVLRFDPRTHERLRYTLPDVVLYLQPIADKLWIGTVKGLFTASISSRRNETYAVSPLQNQRIGQILPDGGGGAWITASSGVYHFHADGRPATEVISGKLYSIGFALAFDQKNELWFASRESGIYRAELNGDRALSIVAFARPLLHSRQVYSILVDKRGWVWCGGDAGFDVYRNGSWALLNSASGLITDDPNNGALLEAKNGSIWIGTSQGISQILSPENMIHARFYDVALLSTAVDDKKIMTNQGIDVPSGGGMVKIHLGASEHEEEADAHLMYRIPGVLSRWEEVQGNYIHLAQSIPQQALIEFALLHDDGSLASSVKSIHVKIHPAWWQSDGARIMYGIVLLSLLFTGWKLREKQLGKRSQILEEIVANRTAEIAEKNCALEQARVQLEFEATHDSLTGLMNRSAVMRDLNKEVDRCRREPKALSVAILDLDHFKQINDRYGHAAGDAVLVEVSRRMSALLRSYDVLGRFGGEEFVIAFPEMPHKNAGMRLDEIRWGVAENRFNVDAALIQVTISIGYACWQEGDSVASLLSRADEALYRAKNEGRNRVCMAQSTVMSNHSDTIQTIRNVDAKS